MSEKRRKKDKIEQTDMSDKSGPTQKSGTQKSGGGKSSNAEGILSRMKDSLNLMVDKMMEDVEKKDKVHDLILDKLNVNSLEYI